MWNLLGPSFQAGQGSYSSWLAGYSDTGAQDVQETSESGDTVYYALTSYNPDGTVQSYTGYAIVSGGQMQSADLTQVAGGPVAAPAQGPFFNMTTLAQSVADEQAQQLSAAPAADYNSPDNATVSVTCTAAAGNTVTCSATDSDGDVGRGEIVTIGADGSYWDDTGFNWTGPDVSVGTWATPDVVGWTAF